MDLSLLIALFPIVFMLHDFEEIIMMQSWLKRNKDFLIIKFPKLGKRIIKNYENQSTASFSLAVAEEFFLISVSVVLAIQFKWYYLWIALFMAFFVHLLIHIAQWIVIRKYIPVIFTSFLAVIYCVYAYSQFMISNLVSSFEIVWLSGIGLVIMILNLLLIHKMAAKFEIWLKNFSNNN